MRGHIERILFVSLVALAAAVLLLMFYQNVRAEDDTRTYNISVLVRAPSDRFMKGIEQAALDYNVDLHVFSSYAKNDTAQQIEYLQRELDSDVDAVVVSAEDPAALSEYLDALRSRPAVVTVRQKLQSSKAALHVGADDYLMGAHLGQYMARQAARECLILCPYEPDAFLLERLDGLTQTLTHYSIPFSIMYCEPARINVDSSFTAKQGCVIAILDESLLIPVCEEVLQSGVLYGVGYVSGARIYLESGHLNGLVVYSEYDAGYLSLQAAVKAVEGPAEGGTQLTLYTATAENMYSEPLVNVLFPIG